MQIIFLVPFDELNASIEHCPGGQTVSLKNLLPVCAYLGLSNVVVLPVWIGFRRKGVPMPRNIGPTSLIKKVNVRWTDLESRGDCTGYVLSCHVPGRNSINFARFAIE